MHASRDIHPTSISVRKAEVRNSSEARNMQKAIERSYKEYKQTMKNIEKEQSNIILRAKLHKLPNKKGKSLKLSRSLTDADQLEKNQNIFEGNHRKVLPSVRVDTEGAQATTDTSLENLTLSSPAIRRRKDSLSKTTSLSMGNLESIIPRRHTNLLKTNSTSKLLRNPKEDANVYRSVEYPQLGSGRVEKRALTHAGSFESVFQSKTSNSLRHRSNSFRSRNLLSTQNSFDHLPRSLSISVQTKSSLTRNDFHS